MNAREETLDRIFSAAVALPLGEREAFLIRECADDGALRERVRRLLRAHAAAGGFLETPLTAAAAEGIPGAQIGRYRLLEKIGEGGVGVVFKAEQSEPLRRIVALKLIKPGMDTH